MNRFLESKAFLAIVFALFAAVTLWTTLHHEPWFDEADSWLVMRDGDAHAIFGLTAYRGTPLLWYLVIWPFAAAGAPFLAQQLLNLLFVWAAVALLFRSSAFPPVVKALFAFSYYPAFEYSAISRNYGLLMLLLFLAASQWRSRHERPFPLAITLALMANTAVHGLVIAAVAGLLLLIETRRIAAAGITLAGGIMSVIQLWPRDGGWVVHQVRLVAETTLFSISGAFFPEMHLDSGFFPALLVLVLIAIGISRSVISLAFLLIVWSALLALYIFVWLGGMRHAGLLLLVAIAAIWMANAYGPYRRERLMMAALAVALGWSIHPALQSWIAETRWPYSASRETAQAIRKTGVTLVVTRSSLQTSPFVDLPDVRVYVAATEEFGPYTRWSRRWQQSLELSDESVIKRAEERLRGQRWLLLLRAELTKSQRERFRLLYRTEGKPWGQQSERYWLYEPLSVRAQHR